MYAFVCACASGGAELCLHGSSKKLYQMLPLILILTIYLSLQLWCDVTRVSASRICVKLDVSSQVGRGRNSAYPLVRTK